MALHKKTLFIISVAIAGLIGVLYTTSSTILLHSLRKAEEQDTRQIMQGVLGVFNQSQDDFSNRFKDWSEWDDAYTFVQNGNEDYIKANLVPRVFENLNVNLALYINSSGRLVYGTGFDLKTKKKTPIPEGIRKHLFFKDLLLQHPNSNSSVTGIVLVSKGPMLVTSQPIVTSSGQGPIRGTLIYGQYLDSKRIEKLIRVNRLSITFHDLNERQMPPDFQTVRSSLSKKKTILVRRLNEHTIAGYSLLPDIYGKPAVLLRVDVPREIYSQGQTSLYYLMASLLVVGLVFCGVALLLLERLFLIQQKGEELKQLSQLKDDFLSTVSHELRTPVTNMKMAIKMLRVTFSQEGALVKRDQADRYLKILDDECAREINLINDLLDLQRLEAESQSLALEMIDLLPWLLQLIEPFKERADNLQQTLKLDIPPKLPPLVSSPSSLERVLVELLNNACKYTPPGEKITLSAYVKSGMIHLSVSNSGIEIPASEQPHIFDKFYRIPGTDPWKQGGTGLGLALVQKLTKHLGGSIRVESACGQTCFTVELPINDLVYK